METTDIRVTAYAEQRLQSELLRRIINTLELIRSDFKHCDPDFLSSEAVHDLRIDLIESLLPKEDHS